MPWNGEIVKSGWDKIDLYLVISYFIIVCIHEFTDYGDLNTAYIYSVAELFVSINFS